MAQSTEEIKRTIIDVLRPMHVHYSKGNFFILDLTASIVLDPAASNGGGKSLPFFGIKEEERKRIFSPFVQLEGRPFTEAGTGLGLAISKQYVELMGGEIGVVGGSDGVGTIFFFEIPVEVLPIGVYKKPLARGTVVGVVEEVNDYRLLIAEDQPENRFLLKRLLTPFGFEIKEAVNGEESIALWHSWRPHLIFMDIRMPVMDGLEATRRIKVADTERQTVIVVITAHVLEEEQRAIMAAGCDDFIRKPFHDWEIFDALSHFLGVGFVFENEPIVAAPGTQLDAVSMSALPRKVRRELEQALCRIDCEAVRRAIKAIRDHDPALAEAMAAEANNLQYGRLLRVLRTAADNSKPEESV